LSAHDLHAFMDQITTEMGSEYARIYARAAEDPGTAGDEGEENWARLLKEWLPPTYHIETKGRLIGHDGLMSPQIDVVVLKPSYPKKLLEKKIWLASGVAAAFECKTTITAAHISASIARCVEFKRLYAERNGTPRAELVSPLIYGILAHSHSWKAEKSDPIGNVKRALDISSSIVTHPRFEVDVLCIADLATWSRSYITHYEASWKPEGQAELTKLFGAACGPMTSIMCGAPDSDSQKPTFRPIGKLIEELTRRLAWADPSVRDISDYFRLTNLGGSSSGQMRPWPLSIYSDSVAQQIVQGRSTNGVSWDE